MRNLLPLLLVSVFLFSQCQPKEPSDTGNTAPIENKDDAPAAETEEKTDPNIGYVNAISGLNMRDKPDLESKKIDLIPFGEKLKILLKTEEDIYTDDFMGKMYKVAYKDKTGYVFSPYLSNKKPVADLIIKEKCIILRRQDSIEIDRLAASLPEEDLAEVASDIGFYFVEALDLIKTRKDLKLVETEKRFIQVEYGGEKPFFVDAYSHGTLLILNNGKDKPKAMAPINLTVDPDALKFMDKTK